MKKIIGLVLLVAMLLPLGGCGGSGEYSALLAHIESGNVEGIEEELCRISPEYLRKQEENAAVFAAYEAKIAELEAQAAAADSVEKQDDKPVGGEGTDIVIDTLLTFMKEKGEGMTEGFVEVTGGMEARETELVHAMEYRLGNCDGKGSTAHCMLMYLSGDFLAGDGIYDAVQILLDMDSGKVYDSTEIDWSVIEACEGMPTNEEEFNIIALNSYHSYIAFGQEILMADSEICEAFDRDEIALINETLK